ncbi:MAG: hypothetical protein QM734_12595 [Cyclobacteriaceae bacterium]
MLKKISNLAGVTPLSNAEQKNLKGGLIYCPGGPSYCCGPATGPGPGIVCGGYQVCGFGALCIYSCACSAA